jgi:hypothetical protein
MLRPVLLRVCDTVRQWAIFDANLCHALSLHPTNTSLPTSTLHCLAMVTKLLCLDVLILTIEVIELNTLQAFKASHQACVSLASAAGFVLVAVLPIPDGGTGVEYILPGKVRRVRVEGQGGACALELCGVKNLKMVWDCLAVVQSRCCWF